MSQKIPIKEIAVIDRQRKEMKKIPELADSIKEVGRLINPVTVRLPDPEADTPKGWKGEPYILKTGGRRMAAHILLGWPEIEANVWEECDPLMREIIELRENIDRENITWPEELEAKERIHALRQRMNPGHTATQTAKEVGESKANLSKDLNLARMMREDPSLKSSPTKKAALRKVSFREDMDKRVKAIKSVNIGDLRSKIVTADMRDYVRSLETNSIDLCFTDFPFGIDYDVVRPDGANSKGTYRDDPGQMRDLLADVIPHIVRVVKPTGWIACMMGFTNYGFLQRHFMSACKTHQNYADIKWSDVEERWVRENNWCTAGKGKGCEFLQPEELPWFWHRPNSRQPSLWPELHANNQYELICVVNGGQAKLVRPNVPNVLVYNAVYTDRIHEMQRPHDLCVEVITRLTLTGETVLDLCYGSGAHLAAAADTGREFKGCDINPDNLAPALGHVAQYYKKVVGSISPDESAADMVKRFEGVKARREAEDFSTGLSPEEEAMIGG